MSETKLESNNPNVAVVFNKFDPFELPWVGVPDTLISRNNLLNHDAFQSKIGGNPAWLSLNHLKASKTKFQKAPKHPSKAELKCSNCENPLYLVLQAYCPIDSFDRFLYVFGCNNAKCISKKGSWIAFRASYEINQNKNEPQSYVYPKNEEKYEEVEEENDVFDEELMKQEAEEKNENNSTITNSTSNQEKSDDIEELMKLRDLQLNEQKSNDPKKKKQKKKKKKKKKLTLDDIQVDKYTFPCYTLDIFEDDDDDDDEGRYGSDPHAAKLYREYKKREQLGENEDFIDDTNDDGDNDGLVETTKGNAKNTESFTLAKEHEQIFDNIMSDEQFIKFQTKIEHYPSQAVRWQFGGVPLWISDRTETLPADYGMKLKKEQLLWREEQLDEQEKLERKCQILSQCVPRCENCGAARVFELQLIPTLMFHLKVSSFNHIQNNEGMDFGTVTIFSCERNCTFSAEKDFRYLREYVHIQPPLDSL